MDKARIREIADVFLCDLNMDKIVVEKLILFGSGAREEMTADSDLDFALVSKMFIGKSRQERSLLIKRAITKLIREFLIPVDVITLTPEELADKSRMIAYYVAEGSELYAA
ncbi:MAG: nucleotidyltransferase domain-containing protein [Bacillota bacterium]